MCYGQVFWLAKANPQIKTSRKWGHFANAHEPTTIESGLAQSPAACSQLAWLSMRLPSVKDPVLSAWPLHSSKVD